MSFIQSLKMKNIFHLDNLMGIVSLLSISLLLLGLLFLPSDNENFYGTFFPRSQIFTDSNFLIFFLYIAFIFLVRGTHSIITWWLTYFDPRFIRDLPRNTYIKNLIIKPIALVIFLLTLFGLVSYYGGKTGFFIVIFISLVGPFYSYHVTTQDFGIMNMLLVKSQFESKILQGFRKSFIKIRYIDMIFHCLPFFLIFETTYATLKSSLDFLMVILTFYLFWILGSQYFKLYNLQKNNIRLSTGFTLYAFALFCDFFSRILFVFGFGGQLAFYYIRVTRHVVGYIAMTGFYVIRSLIDKDNIFKNYIKKKYLFVTLFTLLVFGFFYSILLLTSKDLDFILINNTFFSSNWHLLESIAVTVIGTFSMLHYYLDSLPWKISQRFNNIRLNKFLLS